MQTLKMYDQFSQSVDLPQQAFGVGSFKVLLPDAALIAAEVIPDITGSIGPKSAPLPCKIPRFKWMCFWKSG